MLGTIQAHRAGRLVHRRGRHPARRSRSASRVNVNVRFRGRLDVNLGCDQQKFFDFSVPFVY